MAGLFASLCGWLDGLFPVLGRHACHVVGAYVLTTIILGALIWATLAANARTRRALDALERDRTRRNG